jgi:hypothetical protein
VFQGGVKVGNGHPMTQAHVGHAHAPSWDVFERHLPFRMSKGSYRRKENETMALHDVLEVLLTEDTRNGLRRFYDEICQATPRLVAELDAHGMLLTAALDLDDKVTRWFGDLPDWAEGPVS